MKRSSRNFDKKHSKSGHRPNKKAERSRDDRGQEGKRASQDARPSHQRKSSKNGASAPQAFRASFADKRGERSSSTPFRKDMNGRSAGSRDEQRLPSKPSLKLCEGRLDLHPDGFGFLIPKDPSIPNIYIGQESLKYVMNRDVVRVKVEASWGDKLRGTVIEILEHHQKEFIGHLRQHPGGALAIPLEARDRKHTFKIKSVPEIYASSKNNQAFLFKITEYPGVSPGHAEVVEILHDPAHASNDTLRVLISAAWPRNFSAQAVKDAENAAENWTKDLALQRRRKDIRNLPLVTIDGRDARDFDDAVCAKKEGSNIRLWVAIADVSHFVKPGTKLDLEAYERSTSVYFPDFVVPMLPEVLSNGVCSLNPFEDRACLVCESVVNADGIITSYECYEGLMKSQRRLTYEDMQAYIDDESWAKLQMKDQSESLDTLIEVFHKLNVARKRRGSIDLDIGESQVFLNSDGGVRDIQARTRLDAHRLIEECMLAANQSTAKFLSERAPAGVYRIHEEPDRKKIDELQDFLKLSALYPAKNLKLEKPKDFANLLDNLKKDLPPGDPKLRAIQNLLLRCMKQACYSTEGKGHFALADSDYTHFTSPIRRYPDLMVHRLIKETLKLLPQGFTQLSDLESRTKHCSEQERAAMDCERKLIDIKKCRFMEAHLGEDFEAWVGGVTEKGIFCQIDGHFVDGLIHTDQLGRDFKLRFDPGTLNYVGANKMMLGLGARVRVQLVAVDTENRKIDFALLKILNLS